jgi:hypothetical protein
VFNQFSGAANQFIVENTHNHWPEQVALTTQVRWVITLASWRGRPPGLPLLTFLETAATCRICRVNSFLSLI